MEELVAIIALSRLKGYNATEKKRTLEEHGRAAAIFNDRGKIPNLRLQKSITAFSEFQIIKKELSLLSKMGARAIPFYDNEYPPMLRNIPDAPLVLYAKGPLDRYSQTIAVVGSRDASTEALNLAEKASETLSSLGITVVSGLARGVDAAAHRGALRGKAKTIGVLGCGINICYPAENRFLYRKLFEEGLVVTEYGLGEKPLQYHFPERNRIIAGLSRGVLVVEASNRSGSLITARLALEYGREVMAVPGSVYNEKNRGVNNLIKEGAKLVDCIEDIISTAFPDLLPDHRDAKKKVIDITVDEDYIYSLVGYEKIHVDDIIGKSSLEARQVLAVLTTLEMKELIRQSPGGFFIRK